MQCQAAAETQQQQKQQQAVAEQLRRAEVSHGLHVDRSAQQAADAIDLPAGSSTEATAARECGMRGHDMHACMQVRRAHSSSQLQAELPTPAAFPAPRIAAAPILDCTGCVPAAKHRVDGHAQLLIRVLQSIAKPEGGGNKRQPREGRR